MKWPIFSIEWRTLYFSCTYSTNILVRLLTIKCEDLSYAKNQKMCNPILVTLLKQRSHYIQSSHKNATPSSGTSPLASYKEVPPTPPPPPPLTTPLHRLFENCLGKNNWCNWAGNYLSDWWKSTIANPGVHLFLGGGDGGHFLNSNW